MTTGVRFRRSDGGILFDSTTLTFQLLSKGTVTTQARLQGNTNAGSALIPIPYAAAQVVIATRSTFYIARVSTTVVNGQAYMEYATAVGPGSTFDYWLFAQSSNFAPAHVGMNLRDPSGLVTYSSAAPVLKAMTGALPAGRTYAVAQQGLAGHRLAPRGDAYYINGTLRLWNGQPMASNTRWGYRNDGKLYGTCFSDTTLQTAALSWDDVIVTLGSGSTPPPYPPDWDVALGNLLTIDVTNL